MTTFDPPRPGAVWQLPWLRLSLILRRMATSAECRHEDIIGLLAVRREIAQRGWFN